MVKAGCVSARQGVTLLELLVAMGVVGLLVAILVPAVQVARESARQTHCRDHLRQFGMAIHNRAEAEGVIAGDPGRGLLALLRYLDHASLETISADRLPGLPLFLCPSDSHATIEQAAFNYLFNGGNHFVLADRNGVVPVSASNPVRIGDITDGLSQTAAVAERLYSLAVSQFGSTDPGTNPRRYTWYIFPPVPSSQPDSVFVEACRDNRATPFSSPLILASPLGQFFPPYSHLLPPNSVGCFNAPPNDPSMGLLNSAHGVTSTSSHPGGMHLSYCDGHVSFVSEGVDIRVWRAIGSRNDHDGVGTTPP